MAKEQFKLGDMIAALTKAFHIPHCEKCEKRRLILNEIRKHGIRETVRRLNAVGDTSVDKKDPQSVEKLVRELRDCCDK